MINVGDIVVPKTPAGLCLANVPVDGDPGQVRRPTCILKGEGVVVETHDVVIDYDTWGGDYLGIGKVKCRSCLIKCEAGQGWAGEGALRRVRGEL